ATPFRRRPGGRWNGVPSAVTPQVAEVEMSERNATRAEVIERDAWADVYRAAAPLGLSVREVHGARVLLAPRFEHPFMNRTIGLAAPEDVEEVIAAYALAGVQRYFVHCAPAAGA